MINDKDVVVEYNYYPPSRGARDSLSGRRNAGPPLEPDDDAEIEIVDVRDAVTDDPVDYDSDEDTFIERAFEDVNNKIAD